MLIDFHYHCADLPSAVDDLLRDMDSSGVPREARLRIEELFRFVQKGELSPSDLKLEIDRWGLFREYEDRFLGLFRR